MKKKVSIFMMGLSLMVVTFAMLTPQEAKAGDKWDNIWNGKKCKGSGAYCWSGRGNPPVL